MRSIEGCRAAHRVRACHVRPHQGFFRAGFPGALLAVAWLVATAPPAGAATLQQGDLLALRTNLPAAVVRVDPVTGAQEEVSVGSPLLGESLDTDENGTIYVVGPSVTTVNTTSLVRVDPITGEQSLVADGLPQGFLLESPGIAVVDSTLAYVSHASGIVSVDLATGGSAPVISMSRPGDLILDTNGDILVTRPAANQIVRVNPVTGEPSVVASGTGTGGDPGFCSFLGMTNPFDLAREGSGNVLVGAGFCLVRLNPNNGALSQVSSVVGSLFSGVDVETSGQIVASDRSSQNRIARINPSTGMLTPLATGLGAPADVVVLRATPVPEPGAVAAAGMALASLAWLRMQRTRRAQGGPDGASGKRSP